jgi:hemoglobin-like flavoprotein
MTPEQKTLVQETWRQVVPIADTAASLFYGRLFELDPKLRGLFHQTDMREQRRKLMQVIGVAVAGLDDLDKLVSVVTELGRRHKDYGVQDRHYETVGAALLWTLEQGLGSAWSQAAAEAWGVAYGVLSGVMRDGANAAPQSAAA